MRSAARALCAPGQLWAITFVIVSPSQLGNYKIADSQLRNAYAVMLCCRDVAIDQATHFAARDYPANTRRISVVKYVSAGHDAYDDGL